MVWDIFLSFNVPRGILNRGWLSSGQSQAMDSAIGENLLAINSCRTNYQDDCFSVLHRARNKVQLNILKVIYIALDRPSLCRQRSSHTLHILGDVLNTGVTVFHNFFFSPRHAVVSYFKIDYPFLFFFRRFAWIEPDERALTIFYFLEWFCLPFTDDSFNLLSL